ncbi:hypothetical protein AAMO2058_000594400 [Amorphochlora amoebiformis]
MPVPSPLAVTALFILSLISLSILQTSIAKEHKEHVTQEREHITKEELKCAHMDQLRVLRGEEENRVSHVCPEMEFRNMTSIGRRRKRKCSLCKLRVAILIVGHFYDAFKDGSRVCPIVNFVRTCRKLTKKCDVFIHTWQSSVPNTKSYRIAHKEDPNREITETKTEGFLQYHRACSWLNCTELVVEKQEISNLDVNREWLNSGVSYEGHKMNAYSLYKLNHIRKLHNARFKTSHNIVVKIRPDYYRTNHGGVMPAKGFQKCFSTVSSGKIYGIRIYNTTPKTHIKQHSNPPARSNFTDFFPGGSYPRKMSDGQVMRPWDGNSGDNFFYAKEKEFDKIASLYYEDYGGLTSQTARWNRMNPEALLGSVVERLKIIPDVCG